MAFKWNDKCEDLGGINEILWIDDGEYHGPGVRVCRRAPQDYNACQEDLRLQARIQELEARVEELEGWISVVDELRDRVGVW